MEYCDLFNIPKCDNYLLYHALYLSFFFKCISAACAIYPLLRFQKLPMKRNFYGKSEITC